MASDKSEVVIARFNRPEEAKAALKKIESALNATGGKLEEGSLVSRSAKGEVEVVDLKDTGFSDIVTSAADLTLYLGIGVAKIALNTFISGLSLLLQSTGHFFDLTGAVVTFPLKKLSSMLFSGDRVEELADSLEAGAAAIVVKVNGRNLSTLRETLKNSGGQLVNLGDAGALEGVAGEIEKVVNGQTDQAATAAREAAAAVDSAAFAAGKGQPTAASMPDKMPNRAAPGPAISQPSMDALEDRVIRKDLTEIEGIGPKIKATLNGAGIRSFADLAAKTPAELRIILGEAGLSANPDTWPRQAGLAMRSQWAELAALQERLQGGIER